MVEEYRRARYLISTDKGRLDVDLISDFLHNESYWASQRPRELVVRSIEHSVCFGLYRGDEQVGFARVVTDFATFGWLADVFVLKAHRGQGLGKWLIETVVAHPQLVSLKIFLLATRDAQGLYRRHGGFEAIEEVGRWMRRV